MVADGAVSCIRRLEKIDGGGGGSAEEVHVLAVDDSLVDRKVIERLLRVISCKVTAVDSGWRALQLLGLDEVKTDTSYDRLKVDLIITDYCMPGMTGYELLKKVKESSNFREIPVVIMSSENVLARIDRCLEEGAEDFLIKPVKLSDVKRLREYMTRDVKSANGIKRKLREDTCDVSSSSPSPPSSASPSPSDSSSSPSPSPPDSSDLSSPQPPESPNRRQKTTSPVSDWNEPCDLSPFNIK